jgi:hypothetical protein
VQPRVEPVPHRRQHRRAIAVRADEQVFPFLDLADLGLAGRPAREAVRVALPRGIT